MKPLASIALAFLVASAAPAQQDRSRLYSTPCIPPREVLERLNLREAWNAAVPMESKRDGILSFQFAPLWSNGKPAAMHALVQTRSGLVVALDAETGQTLWRTRVGLPYSGTYGLGFNNRVVVVERATDYFGLSRRNGEVLWKMERAGVSSAAPQAGAGLFYLCLGTTQVAYFYFPGRGETSPTLFRSYRSPVPLQFEPAQTETYLVYPSPSGSVACQRGSWWPMPRARSAPRRVLSNASARSV